MYNNGLRGIHIAELKKRLMNSTSSDDEFKIFFSLFVLKIILCPVSATYINPLYLRILKDINSIGEKNCVSWCFIFCGKVCKSLKKIK